MVVRYVHVFVVCFCEGQVVPYGLGLVGHYFDEVLFVIVDKVCLVFECGLCCSDLVWPMCMSVCFQCVSYFYYSGMSVFPLG